jgi:rhodanese-related sulfurtransferase
MMEICSMKFRMILLLAALFLAAAAAASAQNFGNITAEQLKQAIDQQEKIVIVDTRTSQEYQVGHIPTAINIPPQDYSFDYIESRLPKDRDTPLVFYCRGYT